MPFWRDCLGCSGDCVGQVETYEIDSWFIGPGSPLNNPDSDPPLFYDDLGGPGDVAVGDRLTVVGTPQIFYTFEEGSTGGAGCSLPGCVVPYPDTFVSNYITLPGSADVIPASPWCPDGGVLVSDDVSWSHQTGAPGPTLTVTAVNTPVYDHGFRVDQTMKALCTAIFGELGEITNAVVFFMLHNEDAETTYGVLSAYKCSCF